MRLKFKQILSCDPEINEWAQSQIGLYENASRAEIVSLPLSKQRAIYAGLSCDKKVALWKEKIKILTESGELSQDELLDINQMMFWFESIKNQSKKKEKSSTRKQNPIWNKSLSNTTGIKTKFSIYSSLG